MSCSHYRISIKYLPSEITTPSQLGLTGCLDVFGIAFIGIYYGAAT
jgi:hypothetical protein